jgi:hypothetical protein
MASRELTLRQLSLGQTTQVLHAEKKRKICGLEKIEALRFFPWVLEDLARHGHQARSRTPGRRREQARGLTLSGLSLHRSSDLLRNISENPSGYDD